MRRQATRAWRPNPATAVGARAAGTIREAFARLWSAWLLLTAMGLDNAAVAGGIPGPPRQAGRAAAGLLAAACGMALAGGVAGRLVRSWLGGWAQVIGAMLLLALMVDALRTRQAGRLEAPPRGGPGLRRCLFACLVSLDDLGIGFAAGALPGLGAPWWVAACALQAACGGMAGLALRPGLQEGRRLAAWSALALGAGALWTLAAIPITFSAGR